MLELSVSLTEVLLYNKGRYIFMSFIYSYEMRITVKLNEKTPNIWMPLYRYKAMHFFY